MLNDSIYFKSPFSHGESQCCLLVKSVGLVSERSKFEFPFVSLVDLRLSTHSQSYLPHSVVVRIKRRRML